MGIFKKGENYYIDYYVNGKRKREMIGPNKMLAKKALDARRGEVVRQKYKLPDKKKKFLFEEFAEIYLNYVKGYKKSARSDLTSIRNMMPFFKGKRLDSIHPFIIESFKIQRKKHVKPASINRELACLKHMYNMAIQWGYAEDNPMKNVKLFKENNERLRYLSKEEEGALIEASAPHLRPIVIVALNTGVRKGEIFYIGPKESKTLCEWRVWRAGAGEKSEKAVAGGVETWQRFTRPEIASKQHAERRRQPPGL